MAYVQSATILTLFLVLVVLSLVVEFLRQREGLAQFALRPVLFGQLAEFADALEIVRVDAVPDGLEEQPVLFGEGDPMLLLERLQLFFRQGRPGLHIGVVGDLEANALDTRAHVIGHSYPPRKQPPSVRHNGLSSAAPAPALPGEKPSLPEGSAVWRRVQPLLCRRLFRQWDGLAGLGVQYARVRVKTGLRERLGQVVRRQVDERH